MAVDVLEHDDGVVHDPADGDRQAAQGEDVDGQAGDAEDGDGHEDRERDADGGHQRRAGAAQEDVDDDDGEERAQQALLDEARLRLVDELRLILDDVDADDVAVLLPDVVEDGLDLVGDARWCWRPSAW